METNREVWVTVPEGISCGAEFAMAAGAAGGAAFGAAAGDGKFFWLAPLDGALAFGPVEPASDGGVAARSAATVFTAGCEGALGGFCGAAFERSGCDAAFAARVAVLFSRAESTVFGDSVCWLDVFGVFVSSPKFPLSSELSLSNVLGTLVLFSADRVFVVFVGAVRFAGAVAFADD